MPTKNQARNEVMRLLMKHYTGLYAFVLAIVRNDMFAEDVMQEVAVVVSEQYAAFTPGSYFGAWVRKIARHKIYHMQRADRRAPAAISMEAIQNLELAAEAEQAVDSIREREALRKCLNELSERPRRLVSIRYEGKFDCARIAEAMKMTVAAIHMALFRIRKQLADCIRLRMERGS